MKKAGAAREKRFTPRRLGFIERSRALALVKFSTTTMDPLALSLGALPLRCICKINRASLSTAFDPNLMCNKNSCNQYFFFCAIGDWPPPDDLIKADRSKKAAPAKKATAKGGDKNAPRQTVRSLDVGVSSFHLREVGKQ